MPLRAREKMDKKGRFLALTPARPEQGTQPDFSDPYAGTKTTQTKQVPYKTSSVRAAAADLAAGVEHLEYSTRRRPVNSSDLTVCLCVTSSRRCKRVGAV